MIGLGETALSLVVVAGTLVLTVAMVGLAVVRDDQVRIHALALGGIGPLIILLSVPFWGDGRMVLTAILFGIFLLVASAVSAHAIMAVLKERQDHEREGPAPPGCGEGDPGQWVVQQGEVRAGPGEKRPR